MDQLQINVRKYISRWQFYGFAEVRVGHSLCKEIRSKNITRRYDAASTESTNSNKHTYEERLFRTHHKIVITSLTVMVSHSFILMARKRAVMLTS